MFSVLQELYPQLIFKRLSSFRCHAMPQAVWRIRITMEDRVRSRASLCEFCGGKSGTETIFSPDNWDIPCQYQSTNLSHSSSSYYYSYQKVKQKKQRYIVFGLHKTIKTPYGQERPMLQLFLYFICQWLRIIVSIKEILRSSGFTIPTAKSQRERPTPFSVLRVSSSRPCSLDLPHLTQTTST